MGGKGEVEKGSFTKYNKFRFSVLKKLYMLPYVHCNFRRSVNVAIQEVDDLCGFTESNYPGLYLVLSLIVYRTFTSSLVVLGKISL